MKYPIQIIRKTRQTVLDIIKDLSIEQLNQVPEGFNNNIIWNVAHLAATLQGVCYKRAGLPIVIDEAFFDAYKSGTKPEQDVDEAGVEEIKTLLLSTVDQLEADVNENKESFANYPAWSTRYGMDISSIDEAVAFLPFHEGLHMGYIMALKRVID
ncbi:DinB family protein [Mucilaginibacter agri]|uniref:DinB family protein n=1 Tax=Mucilaginibacter agri TaxID=2695265 RepID=A0A966DU62_9SPHI|nr:DinB family protein [Mucilaginibacter agri]NCD72053.1 DinB family protein [Mucilaginibacter agri]